MLSIYVAQFAHLANAQPTPSINLKGDQDLLREMRSVCPPFLHSGQFGRHPDNLIFGRVELEIGFVVGVECRWRDEFSLVISARKN